MTREEPPRLDDEGRIRLPANVRNTLAAAPQIAVEIRPEGILLRPEEADEDMTDALLLDMLPQDAAPQSHSVFTRLGRLLRRGKKGA